MDQPALKRIRPFFTVLNIVVGWHLLYEGLAKILDSSWSSAGYLANAQGPLAGLFQSLADSSVLLQVTDFLNIAGLTLVGLCIMTGMFTRFAAVAGAVLIGLYYLANPPMVATSVGYASEGHYLIVNKNLIEIVILLIIAVIPPVWYFGLGKLLPRFPRRWLQRIHVPKDLNHVPAETSLDRRDVLGGCRRNLRGRVRIIDQAAGLTARMRIQTPHVGIAQHIRVQPIDADCLARARRRSQLERATTRCRNRERLGAGGLVERVGQAE